jgi:hypothetical protein
MMTSSRMIFKMTEEYFPERRKNTEDRRHNVGAKYTGPERRQSVVDRRLGLDRRRGPGRRLTNDRKSAEEGQMSDEQFEFLMAIEEYKKKNTRPFPTWTEVLEVIKALGYRRVAEPQSLEKTKKESKEKEVEVPLGTWLD